MQTQIKAIVLMIATGFSGAAIAQPPVAAGSQQALLESQSKVAQANKRLVYDFWREVLEAGHLENTSKYLDEGYIQHNPNVPTGRAGFIEFFSHVSKPVAIASTIKAPLIAMTAEGDLVVVSTVHTVPAPKSAGRIYTTTWFDMFRVKNGKITEHWDSALLQ